MQNIIQFLVALNLVCVYLVFTCKSQKKEMPERYSSPFHTRCFLRWPRSTNSFTPRPLIPPLDSNSSTRLSNSSTRLPNSSTRLSNSSTRLPNSSTRLSNSFTRLPQLPSLDDPQIPLRLKSTSGGGRAHWWQWHTESWSEGILQWSEGIWGRRVKEFCSEGNWGRRVKECCSGVKETGGVEWRNVAVEWTNETVEWRNWGSWSGWICTSGPP